MLSKSYTCLPAGTVGMILSLFLVAVNYSVAQAQNQIITPEPIVKSVAPGGEFSFSVKYDVSDGNNELTGIGIRIHYDSRIFDYIAVDKVFGKGSIGITSPQDDTGNWDGDAHTDKVIIAAWMDGNGKWPGEDLPIVLFKVNEGVSSGTDTSINFSASDTVPGYNFSSIAMTIHIVLAVKSFFPVITVGENCNEGSDPS